MSKTLKRKVDTHSNKCLTVLPSFPPQENTGDSKITFLWLVCSLTFSDELAADKCINGKLS